jgi:hypothetical protein
VRAVNRAAANKPTTPTWQSLSALRACGWGKQRILDTLKARQLPVRWYPPERSFDWQNSTLQVDDAENTASISVVYPPGTGAVGLEDVAISEIEIEVLLPADAVEVASPDASKAGKRGPKPGRQRAVDILRKLYPAGLPPNEEVGKATLVRAVEQEWKITPNPLHVDLPSRDVIERVIDELRLPSSHVS